MTTEMTISSPFELRTFEDIEKFAVIFSKSDFAPKDFRGKPMNVIIACQYGYEIGLKPMQALQNIAVINGKPTVFGDAALALVVSQPECGGVKEWIVGSTKDGSAIAYCQVKRGENLIERTFTIDQAKSARLWGKAGPWAMYPERMLQMRARGFALRDAFPDALKGIYLKEEMEGGNNFNDTSKPKTVEITDNEPVVVTVSGTNIDPLVTDETLELLNIVLVKYDKDSVYVQKVLNYASATSLSDLTEEFVQKWLAKLNEENS